MGTRDHPPATGLALAALSAAAAAGLLRVFSGASWALPALGAAIGPHALAALTPLRARRPFVPALLVAGAGILYAAEVVEPGTTRAGIPTGTTLSAFAHHLAGAPGVLRTAVVPVPPRGAALLLALLAIWAAAAVALWCRRAFDDALAAVAPSLVLFVGVAALGTGAHTAVTVAYAAAVGAYLLAHNLMRVAGSTRRLAVNAAAAGALAVALAAAAGASLPWTGEAPLLDYRALGEHGGPAKWQTGSPLVDIRGRLLQNPPVELFSVSADRQAYWRLVALDDFDGSAWVLGEKEAPPVADHLPAGDAGPVSSVELHQHYTLGPQGSRWLPAAFRPTSVELSDAYLIEDVLALVAGHDVSDGLEYEVVSRIPTPNARELATSAPVRGADWARYLALPDHFPARVVDLASRIVKDAGAHSPYESARALQSWLRDQGRFTYALDPPTGHGTGALETFLFETRRGYCEQFAAAFAAMARSVGLPARVAVGFTPGTYDSEAGLYRVTSLDAHAWPEVYLSGIGWTAFEPTPGRYEPTPGDPTGTQAESGGPAGSTPSSTVAGAATTSMPGAVPPSMPALDRRPSLRVGSGEEPGARSWPARAAPVVAVALTIAVTAALLYVLGVNLLVAARRSRRRNAPTNRGRVTGAWEEAIDRLAEAGIERSPSATPVEFALRHAPAHGAGEAGPPLMGLARLHTVAVFSPHEPADDDVACAWEHAALIGAALRSSVRAGPRWRRRLAPRTTTCRRPAPPARVSPW